MKYNDLHVPSYHAILNFLARIDKTKITNMHSFAVSNNILYYKLELFLISGAPAFSQSVDIHMFLCK